MNRVSKKFGAVLTVLTMVGTMLGVVASAVPAGATPSTVVVRLGDVTAVHSTTATQQWAPEDNDTNTGTFGFVNGPGTPPLGSGSLAMSMASGQHEWLVDYGYGPCATGWPACTATPTNLSAISALSYQTYRASGGQMPTLNIEVSPPGNGSGYTTFVYVPDSGAYVSGSWQSWDPFNDTTKRWYSTHNVTSPGGGVFNCTPQAAGCYATWADIVSSYPAAIVLGGIGPNIGSGGTFAGNVDKLTIGVSGSDTVYDFEPECTTTCFVNGATGNDSNTGLAGDPLKTIQAGVNKVSSGGTVQVAAGTYVENVTVTKPLTLAGAGQTSTIVEPAIEGPNPPACGSLCAGASSVVLVQANNVTIHDIGINGDNPALTSGIVVGGADLDARNGIITNHNAGTFNNLSVHDVTVKNVYLRGMYASSGGTFNFTNNTVDNVQADPASIGMFNWVGSGTMTGNHVSNTNDAISANHSSGTTFTNNVITASNIGVHSDNAGDGGGSADVISGNNVSTCTAGGYGVWTFVPYIAPTISNNTVSGCNVGLAVVSSCAIGGVGNCPGSVLPTVTLTGNSVTSAAGDTGLYVTTNSFGYGDGDVRASGDHNTLSGGDDGAFVEETGGKTATVTLTRNAFTGNTSHGVNNAGSTTVAGTCNWWGNGSGPSGVGPGAGDAVTAGVTFGPWLASNDLDGACAGLTASLGTSTITHVEGNAGYTNVTVPVTLNNTSASSVSVAWGTADGTAVALKDYKSANGTLVIPAGQTTGNIVVAIRGDKTLEHNETFSVNLLSATNASLGNSSQVVEILNDDLPSLKLSKPAPVIEGGISQATISVAYEYYLPITVYYATSDITAVAPGDYTPIIGSLTIPAGTVNYTHGLSVQTLTDGISEPSETFQIAAWSSSIKKSPVSQSATIKLNHT